MDGGDGKGSFSSARLPRSAWLTGLRVVGRAATVAVRASTETHPMTNHDQAQSHDAAATISMPPKPGGKHAAIIKLLRRKKGATVAEIAKAIGWQDHSIRGAISGALKRKYGLPVTSSTEGNRGRVYRINKEG